MGQEEAFHWNEDQLGDLICAIPMFTVPPARSGSISSIGYDQDARILALQFRSRRGDNEAPTMIYAYLNFPPDELEALLTAASLGQHVNTAIVPRYECVAVQQPEHSASS